MALLPPGHESGRAIPQKALACASRRLQRSPWTCLLTQPQGTLSSRLVENYDIDFISTGDVLRHEIAAKSDVGREAEKVVASGGESVAGLLLQLRIHAAPSLVRHSTEFPHRNVAIGALSVTPLGRPSRWGREVRR